MYKEYIIMNFIFTVLINWTYVFKVCNMLPSWKVNGCQQSLFVVAIKSYLIKTNCSIYHYFVNRRLSFIYLLHFFVSFLYVAFLLLILFSLFTFIVPFFCFFSFSLFYIRSFKDWICCPRTIPVCVSVWMCVRVSVRGCNFHNFEPNLMKFGPYNLNKNLRWLFSQILKILFWWRYNGFFAAFQCGTYTSLIICLIFFKLGQFFLQIIPLYGIATQHSRLISSIQYGRRK